jgi:hypothetical protein
MTDVELAAAVAGRLHAKVRDTETLGEAVAALLGDLDFDSLEEWSDVLNAAGVPFFEDAPPKDEANMATAFAFAKGLMMGRER